METTELAERVARRDPAAEDELARLFYPRAFALLRHRIRDRERARELASDVVMAVIRALREGRVREPGKLHAYVLGTVRNVARNHQRAARPELPLEPSHEVAAFVDAEQATDGARRLRLLEAAIAALHGPDRLIVRLGLLEGWRSTELTRVLGLSHDAIRARKSRVLRRLARALQATESPVFMTAASAHP
jgi:RNA polymerase sigma factor (sigma-70 family)